MPKNQDMLVALDHVREAVRWAMRGGGKLNGRERVYDQAGWSEPIYDGNAVAPCGTTCCVWGAAYLQATGKDTRKGPCNEWCYQSPLHTELYFAMCNPEARVALPRLCELLGVEPNGGLK